MTVFRIALATFLLQVALQPQLPPASIEGVVVQRGSGETLGKVTVSLATPTGALSTTTASDGKFAFRNLQPGPHLLTASRPGYAFNEHSEHFPDNIRLQAGQRVTGVQLHMVPTGSISGRVIDRRGEPMMGALVHAQALTVDTNGIRTLATVQVVAANDRGEYRLFWLRPGQYYVAVLPASPGQRGLAFHMASGPALANAYAFLGESLVADAQTGEEPSRTIASRQLDDGTTVEEGFVPVYYPATTNPDAATRIDVRPGSGTGGVDIMAAAVPVFRVRGTVVNGVTGLPESPRSISIRPKSILNAVAVNPGTTTIAGSRFEINGLASGSYFLVVDLRQPVRGVIPAFGIASIEIGNSNLDNITITSSPAREISGRIVVEGTSAVRTPTPQDGRATAVTLRVDGRQSAPFEATAFVSPDGSFTLPVLVSGEAQVFVRHPPEFVGYVKSIRMGSSDALLDVLRLDGSPPGSMEIVISTNPGRLEGAVVNDRQGPVAGATVVLIPNGRLRQRSDSYYTAVTDRNGRFNMRSVAPGTYRAFAWEVIERGMWLDPEFMRGQEALGRPVSFAEGSAETIELRMIPYR